MKYKGDVLIPYILHTTLYIRNVRFQIWSVPFFSILRLRVAVADIVVASQKLVLAMAGRILIFC